MKPVHPTAVAPQPSPQASVPSWLQPGVIAALASVVEAEVARGTARIAIRQRVWDMGLALFPALPRTHLAEAVSLAMWVGKAEDAESTTARPDA